MFTKKIQPIPVNKIIRSGNKIASITSPLGYSDYGMFLMYDGVN